MVSLYYELRLILYLGILLLTGGLGYLAYENIGEFGHFLLMLLMAVLAGGGYYFVLKKSKPYSNFIVKESSVYLDYIIVLVALLVVGLFTYIQVYFDLVEELLNYTSLLSAGLFFYMAYRFDNKILLSMAITALVATFGYVLVLFIRNLLTILLNTRTSCYSSNILHSTAIHLLCLVNRKLKSIISIFRCNLRLLCRKMLYMDLTSSRAKKLMDNH